VETRDGVDDRHLHYNVFRNAQAVQRLKTEFKVTVHDTPKTSSRRSSRRRTRSTTVKLEERVLQGSARFAARIREDRRAVLDEDQRALHQPWRDLALRELMESSDSSSPGSRVGSTRLQSGRPARLPAAAAARARLTYEVVARYCSTPYELGL